MDPNGRWFGRFAAVWSGQTLSLIGSKLGGFALVWWLTVETGSATALAAASTALFLPRILLRPIAGVCVDRWSRRWVILISDAFVALFSLWLAVLFWRGAMELWHVYLIVAARAIGGAFHEPAMSASTIHLVPEKHLSRLSGVNHTLQGGLNLAGPLLGALAVSVMPLHNIMLIDVATALFAIVPLFFLSIPQPGRTEEVRRASIWRNMADAVRYIRSVPGLALMIVASALGNGLITPTGSFYPLLATEYFSGGAFHLAGLQSGWAVGYVLGGMLFTLWSRFHRRTTTIYVAAAFQGLGMLLIAFAPPTGIVLATVGMFVTGLMNTYYNAPSGPLFQANIPPELQGRVFSLVGTLCYAAYPIGLWVETAVVERFGVHPVLFLGAGFLVLCGGLAIVPSIRNLEETLHRQRAEREDAEKVTPKDA